MAPNPKRNLDDSERGKKKNANEIIELSDDENSHEMFETQKENNEPQEEKVQVQEEQIETQKEKPIGKIEKSQLLKIHDLQPGKLMIAGMISWKHPSYYKNTKEQKEDINSFHRFTDEMVDETTHIYLIQIQLLLFYNFCSSIGRLQVVAHRSTIF